MSRYDAWVDWLQEKILDGEAPAVYGWVIVLGTLRLTVLVLALTLVGTLVWGFSLLPWGWMVGAVALYLVVFLGVYNNRMW